MSLAREAGAEIAFREWDEDFAAQRNFALSQAKGDWILYLDADERLTPALVEKINAIKKGNQDHQYSFKRINIAFGHEFHHGAFSPDRVKRLFPREKVCWVGKVHERPECPLPVTELGESLHHYTYDSFAQWWNKAGHYTSLWAEEARERGKKATARTAAGHALLGMVKAYVLEGGSWKGAWDSLQRFSTGSTPP